MLPSLLFRHCPRCGTSAGKPEPGRLFACAACGLHYYFNPAVAVAAVLLGPDGRVLLLRRAKDPGKGLFGLPGGFVDIGETAEEALRREILEEVNLSVESLEYLSSGTNQYLYRGVDYPVLDFFFVARTKDISGIAALDDVESFEWRDASTIRGEEVAFASNAKALKDFCEKKEKGLQFKA
jgi:ADP-ribose pyrophosphatase YjhB (NUDIX family)